MAVVPLAPTPRVVAAIHSAGVALVLRFKDNDVIERALRLKRIRDLARSRGHVITDEPDALQSGVYSHHRKQLGRICDGVVPAIE